MSFSKLCEVLEHFDCQQESFSESDIHSTICNLPEWKLENKSPELIAEWMAFGLVESTRGRSTRWGTYFGPIWSSHDENRVLHENPSAEYITKDVLEYWAVRATVAKHPLLRVRYNDLVWEMSSLVKGVTRDPQFARAAIKSAIELSRGNISAYENQVFEKLIRALSLALSLRDNVLRDQVCDALISYEQRVAEDNKIGLWGHSFDHLVDSGADKKIGLSDENRRIIIENLEQRLRRISTITSVDPHIVYMSESCATRLARFYRRVGDQASVGRVLKRLEETALASRNSSAAGVAFAWLERVYNAYCEFGLQEEAERLTSMMAELAPEAYKDLKPIQTSIPIDQARLDQEFAPITAHGFAEGLRWIARSFIPSKRRSVDQIRELEQSYPLQSLLPKVKVDHDGRPVAHVGSLKDDLEGMIVEFTAQNLQYSTVFLKYAFGRFRSEFQPTADDIVTWLFLSPLPNDQKKISLSRGVQAWLVGDWIACTYILIPQIESLLRDLIVGQGAAPYRRHRLGGYLLKNFEEIIHDPIAEKCLGEDVIVYLRSLLSDQRGWNLRNNICHGICLDNQFGHAVCDRLIHVLLIFGLIRAADETVTNQP